ncbi:unnamed protein product [Lampetra fluviatilis]
MRSSLLEAHCRLAELLHAAASKLGKIHREEVAAGVEYAAQRATDSTAITPSTPASIFGLPATAGANQRAQHHRQRDGPRKRTSSLLPFQPISKLRGCPGDAHRPSVSDCRISGPSWPTRLQVLPQSWDS